MGENAASSTMGQKYMRWAVWGIVTGGEWRVASATPLCNRTRAVPLWRSEAKGFSVLLSACIRGLILKGFSEPFEYGMWAVGERTVFFFSRLPAFSGKGLV